MSHQPFESWLFEERSLEEHEGEALRQHLAECGACRSLAEAWGELGGLLHSTSLASPQAGFSSRWRVGLAADRERRRRRGAWWVLGVTATCGLAALIALGLRSAALLRSPALLALRTVEWISLLAARVFLVREAVASFAEGLPPALNSLWLIVPLGILALMVVLWALAIYRYAFQGVRE